MGRVLTILGLLALAGEAPAGEGDVQLKLAAGLPIEDFLSQAHVTSGGLFLYVPAGVKDKQIGGPFEFVLPPGRFLDKIEPFAGDMASLIIYRDALTRAERVKVRAYLNGIYGFMGGGRREGK